MSQSVILDEEAGDIPSDEVLNNESHNLSVEVDSNNNDVHLKFSSREAMRDFAKSILHESYYGSGEIEFYPLVSDGKSLVVDGVRLTENSKRMFVWCK